MSAKVQNMTEGKPLPLIVSFSLPLMLGNVFQQMYTVVDTMVVGKGLGVQALAALGASDWLIWLMLGVIQGLTQGFGIRMAQEFGARQTEELKSTLGCSLVLTLISAAVLTLGGQLAAEGVLRLLQTPDTIIGDTLLYVRIIFLGTPVVLAYNLLSTILRSLGDGRTPLNAMIVASFTNIGLDLLFVLVLRWGIAGAAAATLIAQLVSSLYCLGKIRKIQFLRLEKTHLRMHGSLAPWPFRMPSLPSAA